MSGISEISTVIPLIENPKAIQKLKQPAALPVTLTLLDIFGQRYAQAIGMKLKTSIKKMFDGLHRAFYEIQVRLQAGEQNYTTESCPETRLLIQQMGLSQNVYTMFAHLKRYSYALLAFPQKILLQYQKPELETLQEIEKVRGEAFHQMVELLKIEVIEETKEESLSIDSKQLSLENRVNIAKLYFRGGALIHGRVIYFSEMIRIWSRGNNANAQRRDRLLAELPVRDWVNEAHEDIEGEFIQFADLPFHEFLILCTIHAMESCLEVQFSDPVKEILKEKMSAEEVRSDMACFTANYEVFYKLDAKNLNRSSSSLIHSLQLYFFLIHRAGLPQAEHSNLLGLLMVGNEKWQETIPQCFSNRNSSEIESYDMDMFKATWEKVHKIFGQRVLSEDPDSWKFLFFLWQSPKGALLIDMLHGLASLPRFSMTVSTALKFCEENEELLEERMATFLLDKYGETIEILDKEGVHIAHTEYLFFDPPLKIMSTMSRFFGFVGRRISEFVPRMKDYKDSEEKECCLMLRHHILHPSTWKLNLLADAIEIGAPQSKELLWEALSKEHTSFEQPSELVRSEAKEIVQKLQHRYDFENTKLFSLYWEVVHLMMKGEKGVFEAIDRLIAFCPVLSKENIYFLYHYHPRIDENQIGAIENLRAAWASRGMRFVVEQALYNEIINRVEAFVLSLAEACEGEVVAASRFESKCQCEILSAIFPALQPLTDYFRITNVTSDRGAHWEDPIWATHSGLLRFIFGDVGVYFNWSVIGNRPTLLISFFNVKTKTTHCAFLPIQISSIEMPEEDRVLFYNALKVLSQQVLEERASQDVPVNAPEAPESWTAAFKDANQTLAAYPNIERYHERMWEFLRKVKLVYRNLYLASITNQPPPEFLNEIESLVYEKVEHYVASDEEVIRCRNLFQEYNREPQELGFSLKTKYGEFPVCYRVEPIGDLQENQSQTKLVTLNNGGVRISLQYPEEVLNDLELFRSYFDDQVFLLEKTICFTKSVIIT